MKYMTLGCSNLRVSELCLGAMTFGEEFGIGATEAVSREIFDAFLEAGGNFIDTANIYNHGSSERMLAGFLRGHRERLVLGSKYSLTTDGMDPNAGGSHRKNLVRSLEASLRRLDTEYLDLYWVHGWDKTTSLAELMRALDDQVRAGKILHAGISNAPAWVVASANTLARERGWTPFTALQLHYNLVERSIEAHFFDLARAQELAVTAWSPLASGLLTGKFDTDASPADREGARLSESPRAARVLNDKNLAAASDLSAIAREIGSSPAQAALAWLRQCASGTVIPILGARTLEQLRDNLGALDLVLDASIVARLDALAPPTPAYPESLLAAPAFRTMMFGEVDAQIEFPAPRI